MANTQEASGTQTAVIDTEHTLHTSALEKSLVLHVDLSNMANRDEVELRVKKKILSAGSALLKQLAIAAHAQGEQKILSSVPEMGVGLTGGLVFTLTQTAGTGRNFDWSVESIG